MHDPHGNEFAPRELLASLLARLSDLGRAPKSEIEIDHWSAPHQPRPLKPGYGAVYVFVLAKDQTRRGITKGRVLKVGKAGPKSNARFQSQHYGFSARSTVAGALIANPIIWPLLGIEQLDENNVSGWIKSNAERWNFLIPSAAANITPYLENYLRAALGPALEGVMTREMSS